MGWFRRCVIGGAIFGLMAFIFMVAESWYQFETRLSRQDEQLEVLLSDIKRLERQSESVWMPEIQERFFKEEGAFKYVLRADEIEFNLRLDRDGVSRFIEAMSSFGATVRLFELEELDGQQFIVTTIFERD